MKTKVENLLFIACTLVGAVTEHYLVKYEFHQRNKACVEYETTKGEFAVFIKNGGDKVMKAAILEDCTTTVADKMFGNLP